MKNHRLLLACLLVLSPLAAVNHLHAADKPAAEKSPTYPLRGVVVEIRTKSSTLVVKHEDIPGFMPSMTMPFTVDAATLKAVKPGETITATLVQTADGFALRDVKSASAR